MRCSTRLGRLWGGFIPDNDREKTNIVAPDAIFVYHFGCREVCGRNQGDAPGIDPNKLGASLRRILVIGAGGREHVLAWRLAQDAASCNLHAAPGNPGIGRFGPCHLVPPTDIRALVQLAAALHVDLTIVGPEVPLAAGIVDAFRSRGLRIFGPTQQAAEIESSKVFAKRFMRRWGIPTAEFEIFDRAADAVAFVRRANRPLVIKADGLAAGKGVIVAADGATAERAVVNSMVDRAYGAAGARIVIEDRLEGSEASVLALVNGRRVFPLLPAQDYKRALDRDQGPNTGGMGAMAPAALHPALLDTVVDTILEPAAAAMVREGRFYTGVLYAGIMLTSDGPKALEFNCRFGDPETQVILPLLEGDLAEAMIGTLEGRPPALGWRDGAAVCVVLVSGGYPGHYETGFPIAGLDTVRDVLVFHAGTAMREGHVVTAGGRVLNVVGLGLTLRQARDVAYAGVAQIRFENMHYRTDIGTAASTPARVEAVTITGGGE
jgi:phosphoribosylamine--glycine ligase